MAFSKILALALFGAVLVGSASPVQAQDAPAANWPAKHVTILVGFPAGSGSDSVARFLAANLEQRTGQTFIVQNKPGASGDIAAEAAARAAPDGYTVLLGANGAFAANLYLYKDLGFDPVKDFTPVTTVLTQAFVLLINPATVPVDSVAGLTRYLKAQPGKYAHGAGNPSAQVADALYQSLTGVDVLNVPYKGVPMALNDLLGGRIQFMFVDAGFGIPQSRGNKVKALAVTTAHRISAAPDIPTMAESGVPGFDLAGWLALFLPAHAPGAISNKLAKLSNAIMTSEKGREFLKTFGAEPAPGSPELLAKWVDSESQKWGRIIKTAGIEPQ